jgi:hypothetical protein
MKESYVKFKSLMLVERKKPGELSVAAGKKGRRNCSWLGLINVYKNFPRNRPDA